MKRCLMMLLATGAGWSSLQAQQAMTVHLGSNHHCGFEQVLQRVRVSYPELLRQYHPEMPGPRARTTGQVYDIPVVVHVVYGPTQAAFNIPDSVIHNQISILNKAYRKQHADTGNVRSMFKPLSADAEIQFHLATKDPQGNPSTGITRTMSTRAYFGATDGDLDSMERIKKTALGGKDPWPTDKYLNLWIGNLSDGNGQLSVLGYALPPLNPLPPNWPAGAEQGLAGLGDGVVLQVHSVGSNSALNAALQGIYTKGRCAVHEIGHYLGLQHVFGANGGGPPDCGALADDGMGDTPTQSTNSFDAFSGSSCPPATKNSCGAGATGDLPDMWENYMDYARDACQTLFTHNQVSLMRSVLANQRSKLLQQPSGIAEAPASFAGVYPNPASDKLYVNITGATVRNTAIDVLDLTGRVVSRNQARQESAAGLYSLDLSSFVPGLYFLRISNNGAEEVRKVVIRR